MARRNLLRSLVAASLLALSGTAGLLAVAAPPASAVDNQQWQVWVSDKEFTPDPITVRTGDIVVFTIATGSTTQHTVTFEGSFGCIDRSGAQTCERVFDDNHRSVAFRFPQPGQFPYYDRYAQAPGGNGMHGTVFVQDAPVNPTSTTTAPVVTPTTRTTTTTTAPSTTTTAPAAIHPLVVSDPPPSTTTTTGPAHLSFVTMPAAAPPPSGTGAAVADSGKAKGKPAASTTTTTTAPPAAPDMALFDPATLTPAPDSPPAALTPENPSPIEDVTASLLHNDKSSGDGILLIISAAALVAFLVGAGTIAWLRRSSRYFPA